MTRRLRYFRLLFVFATVSALVAEDAATRSPLPRARLDPATRSAVVLPANEPSTRPEPPLMLKRFNVTGRGLTPLRRPAVEEAKGDFTLRDGGRLIKDIGALRGEAGVWPWIDLFEEEARFKEQRVGVQMVFFRFRF
jgi:hypothetical protein